MAKSITTQFLNQDKREAEAVTVTIPSMLVEGGGRAGTEPVYVQGDEALNAAVIEADTIMTKAYVIVDEAFPAGALLAVDIAGNNVFGNVDLTAGGLVVSTLEDLYFANTQTVSSVISGVVGDVTTGKLRIVLNTVHPSIANGRYAQGTL